MKSDVVSIHDHLILSDRVGDVVDVAEKKVGPEDASLLDASKPANGFQLLMGPIDDHTNRASVET